MRAVASGSVKAPGLSKDQAQEYVSGYPTKSLPETAPDPTKARAAARRRRLMPKQ